MRHVRAADAIKRVEEIITVLGLSIEMVITRINEDEETVPEERQPVKGYITLVDENELRQALITLLDAGNGIFAEGDCSIDSIMYDKQIGWSTFTFPKYRITIETNRDVNELRIISVQRRVKDED